VPSSRCSRPFWPSIGSTLGITTLWPVLLAVAVGLAAGHITLGRVVAYVLGAVVSWVAAAVGAAALPQTGYLSDAIVVVSASSCSPSSR
jgi:hypothetical protein